MGSYLPVAIIGAVAALLAFHDDYDDGLIGRSAFAVIVMMSLIVCLGPFTGHYSYTLPLEVSVLLYGVAAFMVRHAWRFLQFRRTGKYSWDEGK